MSDTIPVEPSPIQLDLPQMKLELLVKCVEYQQRGLCQSYKWLAEISYSLRYVPYLK